MENDNTVLLNPPLFALDKDAPLHYAGKDAENVARLRVVSMLLWLSHSKFIWQKSPLSIGTAYTEATFSFLLANNALSSHEILDHMDSYWNSWILLVKIHRITMCSHR